MTSSINRKYIMYCKASIFLDLGSLNLVKRLSFAGKVAYSIYVKLIQIFHLFMGKIRVCLYLRLYYPTHTHEITTRFVGMGRVRVNQRVTCYATTFTVCAAAGCTSCASYSLSVEIAVLLSV